MRSSNNQNKLVGFLFIFFFIGLVANAQDEKKISGKITTAAGDAMPNVNVQIKGTATGVVTDTKGQFTINVPANATLIISYVGYKTQEVAVKNQTNLSIVIEEEKNELSQVMVIAYG